MFFAVHRLSIAALTLGLLSLTTAPTFANHKDHMPARQLYNLCTSTLRGGAGAGGSRLEAGSCLGYIVGISDTFDCKEADHGFHWDPNKAGGSQMKFVITVLQYIDQHPEAPEQEAHMVVGMALQKAFPCN